MSRGQACWMINPAASHSRDPWESVHCMCVHHVCSGVLVCACVYAFGRGGRELSLWVIIQENECKAAWRPHPVHSSSARCANTYRYMCPQSPCVQIKPACAPPFFCNFQIRKLPTFTHTHKRSIHSLPLRTPQAHSCLYEVSRIVIRTQREHCHTTQ